MRTVNIAQARRQLPRLLDAAAAGEEITITKYGRPVARLCPVATPRQRRELGRLDGQIQVPDDFDTMCEEEIRQLFEEGC